ncbi:MAG: tyrosine-type recombinase/integrase [Planctomycetota bacterium]
MNRHNSQTPGIQSSSISDRPIEDILGEYWAFNADRSVEFNREEKRVLDKYILEKGVKTLSHMTVNSMTNFINECYEGGKNFGKAHYNKYRQAFHTFFSYCIRTKLYPDVGNPIKSIEKKVVKIDRSSIKYLSKTEINDICSKFASLSKASERDAMLHHDSPYINDQKAMAARKHRTMLTLVMTYIFLGLRRSEALWLKWDDIIEEDGARWMYIRPKKDGNKTWDTKTGNEREVEIPPVLWEQLMTHKNGKACDWIFPSPTGKRWHEDRFSGEFSAVRKQLGFPWLVRDFRHTFASLNIKGGKTLDEIAIMMGNSPEICAKYYAHFVPKDAVGKSEFMKPDEFCMNQDQSMTLVRRPA